MIRLFLTATGTDVGKTQVALALIYSALARGMQVDALKPAETGVDPHPQDAEALAHACQRPQLANWPGFYRARLPLAPWAATLRGEPPPPSIDALADAARRAIRPDTDLALIEGAGGPLVPLDPHTDLVEIASLLGLATLLVAPNTLGVLSHTFTALESLDRRGLPPRAVVLNHPPGLPSADRDPSLESNAEILRRRLHPLPVHSFPSSPRRRRTLEDAAAASGLLHLLDPRVTPPTRPLQARLASESTESAFVSLPIQLAFSPASARFLQTAACAAPRPSYSRTPSRGHSPAPALGL